MPDGAFRPRLPGNAGRLRACATYEEAEALLDAALTEIAAGQAAPCGGTTLAAFGAEVLDQRELRGVARAGTDRSRWRQHIQEAYFATWPLPSVTRPDIVAWLDELLRKKAAPGNGQRRPRRPKPLARTTIQNTVNLLRVVLEAALDRGLIRENPARTVRLPKGAGRTHDPWTYLLPQEQEDLIEERRDADHLIIVPEAERLLIAFALGTGMRQGEQWNLELRDLDLTNNRITIRFGGKDSPTKGRRIRRIPILPLARRALDAWLPLLARQDNPHRLVWPLPSGARRQQGKAPKHWRSYLEKLGRTPALRHDCRPVRWHDLRHTCASSLIAGWWGRRWSLEEVKGLLGHRSITTTERYAHLAESVLDAAARDTYLPTVSPRGPLTARERNGSKYLKSMAAPPARIELATNGLGNRCSIH